MNLTCIVDNNLITSSIYLCLPDRLSVQVIQNEKGVILASMILDLTKSFRFSWLRLEGSSGGLLLRGLHTQGHPKQMIEGSVQLSFEYYQAGRLHNLFYGLGGTYCISFFTHCLVLSLDSTGRSLTLFAPSIRYMPCLHQAEQPRLSQAVFGEMGLLGRNCVFK